MILRSSAWLTALAVLSACAGGPESAPEQSPAAALSQALTFHASFDEGMDAAYARGDRRIYSAPSYNELDQRSPGHWGDDIEIAYDSGLIDHALRFKTKNVKALFYTAPDNVAFSSDGWSGTASFWLSLNPAVDLEPGFCDPIQITDSAYNDNAIWVDFTRDNPRQFRMGVFGELDAWNPDNIAPQDNPDFNNRLVIVDQPPFAAGKWTHIVIAYDKLGTPGGKATLYVDAVAQGEARGISEPFAWDPATAAIRLGVNYVGLYDELAFFDRPLTAEEIQVLHSLKGGIAELWR